MTRPLQSERRSEPRLAVDLPAQLVWRDEAGRRHFANGRIVDISGRGMAIECAVAIPPPARLFVQADAPDLTVLSTVRTCSWRGSFCRLGVECPSTSPTGAGARRTRDLRQMLGAALHNPEALERVYRRLATQYHPGNRQTGSPEEFLRVREAYALLSEGRQSAWVTGQAEEASDELVNAGKRG